MQKIKPRFIYTGWPKK